MIYKQYRNIKDLSMELSCMTYHRRESAIKNIISTTQRCFKINRLNVRQKKNILQL